MLADTLETYEEISVPQTNAARCVAKDTVGRPALVGILVSAPTENTKDVIVGDDATSPTRGAIVAPGRTVLLPLRDASALFSVSAAAGQKLRIVKF